VNTSETARSLRAIVLVVSGDADAYLCQERLAERPDVEVLQRVGTPGDALTAVQTLQPDAVFADVGSDVLASRGLVTAVRQASPRTRIVLHAGLPDVDDLLGGRRWLLGLLRDDFEPGGGPALEARLTLADQPRSVSVARSFVTDLLAQWQPRDQVEPARLVASELVANAVMHVHGPCALELARQADVLRVAVADTHPDVPTIQAATPASECGRGLFLVSALSSRWGVDSLASGGKVVWAELGAVTDEVA
jgi:anti-sigma regulatory factor (Ser/Thr protein kinase)